jgi:8-oxo-dGTP diphosphatase
MTIEPEVRAAGGLVVRAGADGSRQVLVVHRPRYEDWSFPKGKLEEGETWEEGALREVEEEAGLRCNIQGPLGSADYTDNKGRAKRVTYFLMEAIEGVHEPNDEVDEVAWLPFDEAGTRLTYERDRGFLRELGRI